MHTCVLTLLAHALHQYRGLELQMHMAGDYSGLPVLFTLGRLYYLCRAAVCQCTRTLDLDEIPPLLPLLADLPLDMREDICAAIAAEQEGRAIHRTTLPPVSQEMIRWMVKWS